VQVKNVRMCEFDVRSLQLIRCTLKGEECGTTVGSMLLTYLVSIVYRLSTIDYRTSNSSICFVFVFVVGFVNENDKI